MFRSKKIAVVVAGAAAALAVGSFAFAAIPGGNGLINGCYNKDTGALRVTDPQTNVPKGCTTKETALSWSQDGSSKAYWTDASTTLTPNTPKTMATLNPPPGLYTLSAKVVVRASGANVPLSNIVCSLVSSGGNGGTADYSYGAVWSDASGNGPWSTLSLQNDNTSNTLVNGGSVSLICTSPVAAEAFHGILSAIQVGALNYQ